MAPKVIALLGSPRAGGNTEKLLREAVRGAEEAGAEVEFVNVPRLKFRSCMEILYCREKEDCAMKDDVNPYYEMFREADGLIVAAPVMTMGIPGALKSFMDRFQVFYMGKYERKHSLVPEEKLHTHHRRCLFLSIGGMNIPNDFDGVILTMRAFCDITDFEYWGEVLQNDMDHVVDITTRKEKMEAAYGKAGEMVTLIRKDLGEG